MIATADTARIAPAKFGRVVIALAQQFAALVVGHEHVFMIGAGWDVEVWVPREGHLSLSLCPVDEDGETGVSVAMVTVAPGEHRAHEVVTGGVVIGEAKGLAAALSIALDRLTLPMRAAQQGDHDPFGV